MSSQLFRRGFGVGKLVYDINLNYLGVRSQSSGVRREERRRKKKKEEYNEKVFRGASRSRSSIAILS
ncbi:MAG: hypothetical protein F6K48_10255 [Okeania sp. SIO3H1]|nr:hypothetical protein [Okeania sp. SIO3H1]